MSCMCPEHCGHLSFTKTSTQNQYKNFKIFFKVLKVGCSIHAEGADFYVGKKKKKENKNRFIFIGKYKGF